jgi:U6 snRNA-associated Sm-like protein LSm4
MVELKNGESFNGHLIDCDTFMNITLREVYQTSADSDRFWKLKEVYIRGSTVRACILVMGKFSCLSPQIKYLQVQPALLDSLKEEQQKAREAGRSHAGGQRGPFISLRFHVTGRC